ncbi:MAG: hypothetical protein DWQ53_09795 [Microcystis flos-aquae DF17]|nr:MAG: hypothetical protein DWQ53_09795 [Microcystis flos-aquae DF17]
MIGLAALGMAGAAHAQAPQEWRYAGGTPEGGVVLGVDTNSIRRDGSEASMWVIAVGPRTQADGIDFLLMRYSFDCGAGTAVIGIEEGYRLDGTRLTGMAYDRTPHVPPANTFDGGFVRMACNGEINRQSDALPTAAAFARVGRSFLTE